MTILFLAGDQDAHAQVVAQKIRSGGGKVEFVDCDGAEIFAFACDNRGQSRLYVNGRPLTDVTCVWDRAKLILELVATPAQRDEFLRRADWAGAYRALAANFAGRVVNDPLATVHCAQKTVQQRVAAQLGLPVPPTLITNSRSAALEFADMHPEMICKSPGRPQLPHNQEIGGPSIMVTCPVERADIQEYDDKVFAHSATMLQQRIPTQWDYRVAVAGGRAFAFRIHAQELETGLVDSRLLHPYARHEPVDLPAVITDALLHFLEMFGLWQGQFDLIEDPDGGIWFIECNPNGQWLWLDPFVDGALSDWYAEALMRQSELWRDAA